MLQKSKAALIIRFSSFGDIVQATFAAHSLVEKNYDVDLLTKKEFSNAFKNSSFPYKDVISYSKSEDSLWAIAKNVSKKNYSLIYDAHNNQRTLLFKLFLIILNPLNILKFRTRSKFRFKRLLLFKLRIDTFPKPFKGASSFLAPLSLKLTKSSKLNSPKNEILLAPSAAWDLKKWPEDYWVELANSLISIGKSVNFIGGPADNFIQDLSSKAPGSINLAGKLSWSETIERIKNSSLLISGDTGVLHIADYFGVESIALMGPSAFGRPSRSSSNVIYKNLPCQPCSKDGRGKCKNKTFKKCLASISPEEVLTQSQKVLS
ncbi:MAG: glycosyltransferase family 9 protein [Bdellovibrionales bacterium]